MSASRQHRGRRRLLGFTVGFVLGCVPMLVVGSGWTLAIVVGLVVGLALMLSGELGLMALLDFFD